MKNFTRWFKDIDLKDINSVGGKNASLGEMYRELTSQGVNVPNGFAITADAYWHFIKSNSLDQRIQNILKTLNKADVANLHEHGNQIRHFILEASLPEDLSQEITRCYNELGGASLDVAVRSSATAEDLPKASFAGQQETYLNIQGQNSLLAACKRCFASLFTDRAISYREDMRFNHFDVGLSIGVQKMVRSDLAASGVMFSIDTETGFKNAVLINASFGLGENIVQGTVNPDEYYVFKPTLMKGYRPILQKHLGSKEFQLVYDTGGGKAVKNIPVPPEQRNRYAIQDDEILTLARWACLIEEHYSKKKGQFTPMDMEWAKDGRTGELFILQARPETVQSQKTFDVLESYTLKEKGRVLLTGRSVGEKIAHGRAHVIRNVHDLEQLKPGEILVTDKTDPDWEPMMKIAAGIITNRGGRTCHAAIVSRELGLPAIVGAENATELLENKNEITLSCAEGETGVIYEGFLGFDITRFNLKDIGRPKTKIMMNIGNPEEALRLSFIPNDGVGLARQEFIINNAIKIHPMALLQFDKVTDKEAREKIEKVTHNYANKADFFVDKLAQGVAMIGAAFYPNDVIVRMSDFKTNEYANLIGGAAFEPGEENPMLGFRGASRYYHPRYQEGFALECKAMLRVRKDMGLTNVKLMIPFCRTIEEGRRVIAEMEKNGLRRSENGESTGLEIYVMCEIPSNVILADDFSEVFDGFSIGSNDLTQLILGVDRDSEIVAPIFDERNTAVKKMIQDVIQVAHGHGRKIGICGQAPSDYPEFSRFLVEQSIDSISLNPDAVIKTTLAILKTEQQIAQEQAA